jgi:hypothetical protein
LLGGVGSPFVPQKDVSHSAPIGEERLSEVLVENAFDVVAEADDQILGGRDGSSLDKMHPWISHSDLTTSVYPPSPASGPVFTPS